MGKRYYWLKLKEDFFSTPKVKKLRRIAGGDTYTIIYLKMMLLSVRTSGKLCYEGVEETFVEEIALTIDEDVENVQVTVNYLLRHGLLWQEGEDKYAMQEAVESIGSEAESASRMRKLRKSDEPPALSCHNSAQDGHNFAQSCHIVTAERHNVTEKRHISAQSDAPASQCDAYIDIDNREDKREDLDIRVRENNARAKSDPIGLFGKFKNVRLSYSQKEDLKTSFGAEKALKYVEKLSVWIQSSGKEYADHYATLLYWIQRDDEKEAAAQIRAGKEPKGRSYDIEAFDQSGFDLPEI